MGFIVQALCVVSNNIIPDDNHVFGERSSVRQELCPVRNKRFEYVDCTT